MTIQELAARDYKNAKTNYLRAKERPNVPADELAHLEELVRLRLQIVKVCPGSCWHWIQPHHNTMARCSECGAASGGYEPEGKLFCSACGARMDGGVLSDPN